MVHVEIGYDVHRLVAGRPLVLGGGASLHPTGLDGHSDANILMHAICDAILGALGVGDIGSFFPNTDPHWCSCRRPFMAAHADMRDIADLAALKTQLEAEKNIVEQRMFALKG